MAQYSISVMPNNPNFVPTSEAVQRAIAAMNAAFPGPRDIELKAETFPEPHFFSAGENCDRIVCPECGTKLTNDDDEWYERLDEAESATNALNHRMEMPCCEKQVLLASMSFNSRWGLTAHIARFRLLLADIDPDDIPENFLAEMEVALDCKAVQLVGAGT